MPGSTSPPPTPLPRVSTALSAEQVVERLRTASKRGRMPGFQAEAEGLFSVAAHGHPFDGSLSAQFREGKLDFTLRMAPMLPIVFAAVLAATVWPGVYFMDEMVAVFLPSLWSPWVTYYWYIPITLLPIPWIWRGLMRKSRASMDASAREAISKIAAEIDGHVEGTPGQ